MLKELEDLKRSSVDIRYPKIDACCEQEYNEKWVESSFQSFYRSLDNIESAMTRLDHLELIRLYNRINARLMIFKDEVSAQHKERQRIGMEKLNLLRGDLG